MIKFGTEGWRGIIADDFTVANVRLVTHAIAHYLQEAQPPGKGVLVAYDCRAQSELFALTAAHVLASYEFPVWMTPKPVSSPAAVFGMLKHGMQGTLMFTASHNPAPFHGIKFKPYYGGAALTEITDGIERHLQRLLRTYERWIDPPPVTPSIPTLQPEAEYLENLYRFVEFEPIRRAGFRVVTDAMHGSGAGYPANLLRRAGLQVIALREERNPWFGGMNPEPIERNLHLLIETVRNSNAHVGLALDGDADRIGAVDENGAFVDSHRIFAVLLRHLIEHRGWRGKVVKTFSVSRMIDLLCRHYHLPCVETPIGFKFICEYMLKEKDNLLMGGEESGGIGITRYMLERDGVLIGCLLLEAMAVSGKSLSQLVHDLFALVGPHFYSRIDVHFEREQMPLLHEKLQNLHLEQVSGHPVERISTLDGIKYELRDGSWLLFRASGTEPVVRVYAESDTQAKAQQLAEEGQHLLHPLLS